MAKKRKNNRIKRRTVKAKDEDHDDDEDDSKIMAHAPMSGTDDLWFSHGVDLENRIIELTGSVGEGMSSVVLRALVRMNLISREPITLYLSSLGGSVYDGFAIYDLIRASPSPVVVYANGKIMSMGVIILLAGDKRYAAKNTRFMMHSLSHGTLGKVRDTKIDVVEAEISNDNMIKIIAERTKLKYKDVKESIDDKALDVWFGLSTAKKYGLLTTDSVRKKSKARKK